jgi:glycosyltransferase involved in cell wall biosynthesis
MVSIALDSSQRDCTFDFLHKKEPIIMAMLEVAMKDKLFAQEMGTGMSEIDGQPALAPSRSVPVQSAIVIPCYNERTRLRVDEFERFLDSDQQGSVLIFVDDGSRDQTAAVLERIRRRDEDRVVVLQQPVNRGKAEAVRSGLNYAFDRKFPLAGFWDADLATPLTAIASFVDLLTIRPELDMIFGARVRLLGRHVERHASRHYMGRAFATAASLVLRLPIYDTQCGAKLFRCTPQIHTVFAKPFLSRWIFDIEIIARYISAMKSPNEAARHIYEFPLKSWVDVKGSKLGPHDFARAAYDLFRIGLKYRA